MPPEVVTPEGELPDYFVPLTPAERRILKERLRSTLRATESALLISAKSDSFGSINPSPQRTLVLNSDSPKQFMHMHHMKTGEEAHSFYRNVTGISFGVLLTQRSLRVSPHDRGHKFGWFNKMRTPETEGCAWWDNHQVQQYVRMREHGEGLHGRFSWEIECLGSGQYILSK